MDKKIENILRENNLFRRTLHDATLFMAYINKDNVYEIVSNAVDELYKDRFDTIIGKHLNEVHDADEVARIIALNQEVYQSRETLRRIVDLEIGGTVHTVDSIRIPLFDDNNEDITGIVVVNIDISETVRVKHTLEHVTCTQKVVIDIASSFVNVEQTNFDEVINASLRKLGEEIHADRAFIFTYNFQENAMDNTYEWCNEGITPEIDNLKGIPISDFLDGWVNEHRAGEYVLINDVEELDKESSVYQILQPQGIQSLLTMPIFNNNECYGFFGFDAVTEKRDWNDIPKPLEILPQLYSSLINRFHILEELGKAKDEAQTANDIRSEFLAKVTHEIRTPLNGISNAIYLIEDTQLDEEQKQYAEILRLSHDSLNDLVDNILNYSRIEAKEMTFNAKDINLEQEIVKLFKVHKYVAHNKELGLYLDYDYSIPSLLSYDNEKLIQVLSNIMHNAIKFTNYGHVMVSVKKLKEHGPYVDLRFSVTDTGIGISKENQERIFDEFFQVNDSLTQMTSGTGLGLTIANEIVRFLKGNLKVESRERKGSTFTFDLTFYVPEYTKPTMLPHQVLLVDITQDQHTEVDSFLRSQIKTVEVCTMDNTHNFQNMNFDIIFVQVNDSRTYSQKLPELKKRLSKFNEQTKKVLLIDGIKTPIIVDTFDLFDHHFELPESTKSILGYVRQDRMLSNSIFRRNDSSSDGTTKKSVLLVDDNAINRKAMAKLLGGMNLDVTEAKHGYEALEIVQTKRFDIIFMDILMPGIDGYETTRRIRELDTLASAVPIIAVTANDVESTRQLAFENGMNGMLSKPLNKEDLNALINDYFSTKPQSTKQVDKKVDLNVFDQKEFEVLYDQRSTRKEIIEAFLDEEASDTERIMDAFGSNSTDYIYKELLYFKGSFAYLKANKIFRLTQTILDLCQQQMLDEALMLQESFLSNYHQLIKELNNYISAI